MVNSVAMVEEAPRTRILSVDDDEIIRGMMAELLSPEYEVMTVDSGDACLRVFDSFNPDIVLLDVQMPGMDGYETCRKLKSTEHSRRVPVIFVSALSTDEERVAGYNAGADDYIPKPFDDEELQYKVQRMLANQARLLELESSRKEALTTRDELTVVTQFIRDRLHVDSNDGLAGIMLQVFRAYGLDGCIHFKVGETSDYWCTRDEVGPLEKAAFDYMVDHNDLQTKGSRKVGHYGQVTILISNMPIEDLARYDRISTNLDLVLETADTRIRSLAQEARLDTQQRLLAEVEQNAQAALVSIEDKYREHQDKTHDMLTALGDTIESQYYALQMTEEQEKHLRAVVEKTEVQLEALFEGGLQLDDHFQTMINGIRQTLARS